MLRQHIISAGLAIFFFIAAHFFLTAYNIYILSQEKITVLNRQVQLLIKQQGELERKERIMVRVNRFINRAKSLGLVKDKWAYYDVNIQEPVSFQEAEKILQQTTNSSSYYFKPVTLHVKTKIEPDKKATQKKPPSISADSPETKEGDILLTLRGGFLVKQR
jgi:hypothetical protein